MQALFIFAVLGLFTSSILAIVGSTTVSTLELIDKQVVDTHEYFRNIAFLITENTVMNGIVVPNQNQASGYLLIDSVVKGSNWSWGANTQDPWGNDIIVKVAREYYALDAGAGGIVVQPQAAALLLVSSGPDKKIDPALQTKLNAASATNINSLMNIEATVDTDDIVYTFNTRRSLEKRWQLTVDAIEALGKTAKIRYDRKHADQTFKSSIKTYYKKVFDLDKGGSSHIFKNGSMKLSDSILDMYKKQTSGIATNTIKNVPNMQNLDNETTNSKNEHISLLTADPVSGFSLSYRTATSSGNIVGDEILYLELDGKNSNSAWLNGSNNFHYEIKIGE